MRGISSPGSAGRVTATFEYDAVGRRRAKTISGMTTNFLHDGLNTDRSIRVSGGVCSRASGSTTSCCVSARGARRCS